AIERIFDKRSHTGWTTSGHTGEDVPVYAYGPGSKRFVGQIENTDHAKIIFAILGKGKQNIVIEDK
ncbi:alkaline phosphatase, partial [Geobacillus stearothermophilus]|nr:alkaline phosphatase [Geobacillus stearothermophilus]